MKNLILTLIITLPLTLWGQGWETFFGNTITSKGYSVQQTIDGGYIITGTANFNGSDDVYLIKTDENGEEQWSNTFGGSDQDKGYSVQQTTDGGYIICGTSLIKTDQNGEEQWSKTFGGRSVQQTTDSGYIICGTTISNGSDDLYLIKTDENGEEQWSKIFGGTGWDNGYSVQQTTDGGYIITGFVTVIPSGNRDVYLIKTDGNGNEQWTQTIGGSDDDKGYFVQQTIDGGYIITGETWSYDIGEGDIYLIKTDENGEEQWSNTFGGLDEDKGYSVQQTQDGGYIITGYTESFGNGDDVYLIKTDENGNELWNKTFGGIYHDDGRSIQQTQDGGYIITGRTDSFGNGWENVYLIKTDNQGNITSTFEMPLTTSERKLEKTINLIGHEVKPQKNTPIIEIFDDGSVKKKIIIEK